MAIVVAPEKPLTLKDVIDVIPSTCRERSTGKALLLSARAVVLYAAGIVGLVLTDTWYFVVPLWAFTGLGVSGMFVIGHDAAHQALTDSRRLNSTIGHVMMFPSHHIYEAWVLGHNHIHHRHTARQGMDFVWHPVTPEEYEAMGSLKRLRHRIEWSWLGAGVYYTREVWWNKMVRLGQPPRKWADKIKKDQRILSAATLVVMAGIVVLGSLGGSVLGGLWLLVKVFIVPLFLFQWVIGVLVYLHHIGEDLPWQTRREWTKVAGQLDSTTVLRVSWSLDVFFNKIMVHVPHHVDPRIPCYHLEEATDAIAAAFPGRVIDKRMSFRDYCHTTRSCKLFDFGSRQWMTYETAATFLANQPEPEEVTV